MCILFPSSNPEADNFYQNSFARKKHVPYELVRWFCKPGVQGFFQQKHALSVGELWTSWCLHCSFLHIGGEKHISVLRLSTWGIWDWTPFMQLLIVRPPAPTKNYRIFDDSLQGPNAAVSWMTMPQTLISDTVDVGLKPNKNSPTERMYIYCQRYWIDYQATTGAGNEFQPATTRIAV